MSEYLKIADLFTCLQQDKVTNFSEIENLVEAIADKFKSLDTAFDKVQFLNDCQLLEAEGVTE